MVDKQSQNRINGKQSDSPQNAIKKSRPPAPPPRPLIVDSISETNEANESIRGTQDLNHSIYYSYQNDDKSKQKRKDSEKDEIKFDESLYLLQNSGNYY